MADDIIVELLDELRRDYPGVAWTAIPTVKGAAVSATYKGVTVTGEINLAYSREIGGICPCCVYYLVEDIATDLGMAMMNGDIT